ncbi:MULTISPECIES: HD domain-containing protein [Sphingobacterium]|uniref:5'-deoxynucleotidase n=1 Tax=Sphingobacterium populi TaxID=1812824 RepID=A0ABW5U9R7_9SPHI|nr:HD domain-containing protein [Sphingobacterium sp. CFCC 11742]
MTPDNLTKQLAFIKEIDKLKYVQRRTKLFNSDRCENSAEHSWHLAVMAIVLAEHANEPINILKVIKMVLVHDVVEIDAGDTFIYDTEKNHENTEEERLGAQRIFGLLPENTAAELLEIWEEFEAGKTPEAKFARAMDRLEPLLQNSSNNGGTWKEPGVHYDKVFAKKSVIKEGAKTLWTYAKTLIEDGVKKGFLRKNPAE